ncbi:hypothetical protein AB0J80_22165 [Actinoplanes sp. NPDC049548]|uniref:hypothetical protein n=1 Tax=Actinoplanes sp. NPDC049548 TaxID=3155152 RepID=UPI00341DF757
MRGSVPLTVAATLLAGALAGCQDGGGGGSSSAAFDPATCQGGTLSVLNQGGITHLDPARLYTSGGGNIPSLLFRTLTTRTDSSRTIVPSASHAPTSPAIASNPTTVTASPGSGRPDVTATRQAAEPKPAHRAPVNRRADTRGRMPVRDAAGGGGADSMIVMARHRADRWRLSHRSADSTAEGHHMDHRRSRTRHHYDFRHT